MQVSLIFAIAAGGLALVAVVLIVVAIRRRPATAAIGLAATPGVRRIDTGRRPASSVFSRVDIVLLLATTILIAYGCVMVYSASRARLAINGQDPTTLLQKQLVFVAVGVVLFVVASFFDYHRYIEASPVLYGGLILLLVLVLTPLGSNVNGANGWFVIGGFGIQPAEFGKAILPAMLALTLGPSEGSLDLNRFLRGIAVVAAPVGLLVLQPDLGTTMVYTVMLAAVLLIAGAKAKHLAIVAVIGVIGVVGAFQLGVVKDYQRQRLLTFLDPNSDRHGTGYNLQQSLTAIGNGGVTGKGLFKGPQTNGAYVPEQQTDFIFTAVGEELGFIGAIAMVGLFTLLVWRGIRIAQLSADIEGMLLSVGIIATLAFQAFLNIAVTVGVMPVTGVTLPLVSAGGSSMLTTCFMLGVLVNVYAQRNSAGSLA